MIIREAKESDATAVCDLLNQLGYPTSEKECIDRIRAHQSDGYKLIVGEVDDAVIGFAALHWYNAFHHSTPVGRLVAFCVDEKNRSHGLGSEMLEFSEKFFREKGCFKIELTSNLRRKESHLYYFHKDYQQTSLHFIKRLNC